MLLLRRVCRGAHQRMLRYESGGPSVKLDGRSRLVCAGVGSVSGVLGTLVGLGGGAIAVPLLKFSTPLTQQMASATCLPVVLCSAAVGALSYHMNGAQDCVDW